ncbi:transcription factor HBP-1b(c38) isoform X1 [Helianthus annuus]|uniref:transcription factor HBP-1b(c38) isoform X1 n=2 Tax=Helianthus annuus TaxID=4232 RepID=UPI000B8F0CBB|nr:transcription factor HBP-1b(c38) isoform X1 [Helianthus annuus]
MGSKSFKVAGKVYTSVADSMPSFIANSNGAEGNTGQSSRVSNVGPHEQSIGFRGGAYNSTSLINQTMHPDLQFSSYEKVLQGQNISQPNQVSNSDTSTEDPDDKIQSFDVDPSNPFMASGSNDKQKDKFPEQKTQRRLAQNREAARKSRLRKKAYVQQLENSRLKLTQLEQEVQRARKQGVVISNTGDQSQPNSGNGSLAFVAEYSRWLEEQSKHTSELRAAVTSHKSDSELRSLVENATTHFNDIFRLKKIAAKADVFHIIYGMWTSPAERCFLWIGGFRSSELLKLLVSHLEPLTEQQLASIDHLQQTSLQAEEALSQGMDALQQSLADTLARDAPVVPPGSSGMANYMGQMAMAMGKLGSLENFLRQADHLREKTLQQLHTILTTRQSARALLAINDYFSRLRALSTLWLARPQE